MAAEIVLTIALLLGLPLAYLSGRRAGFERHTCRHVAQFPDRAPQTYVVVPCPACHEPVECALEVQRSFSGGVPRISATVDATDLEHHTLTHIDEIRRPAA
ncbi:MAG: hypothetical protein ABWZ98_04770 [Nakamurella sp.]